MKHLKQIKDELIRAGAEARLLELNHERSILLKILGMSDEANSKKEEAIIKHVKKAKRIKKKLHWMQRPENRKRVLKRIRAMQKAAREKRDKVAA